jgi:hypothetical protein
MAETSNNIKRLKFSMCNRPAPGQRITVYMRDGEELECTATMVRSGKSYAIIIYHNGRAINENKASGWWPRQN